MKYTKELLEWAVKQADSVMDVMRLINAPMSGGGHCHISKKIKRYGIDTSHFECSVNGLIKGADARARASRKTPAEILCISKGERRTPRKILHRALQEIGRKYECVGCKIADTYNSSPITLEIDHTDGDWRNNNESNLRYICPNCHSQLPTSYRKNMKITDEQILEACKKHNCITDVAKELGETHIMYDRIRKVAKLNDIKLISYLEKYAKPKRPKSGFTGSNKSKEWIAKIGISNRKVDRPSAETLSQLVEKESIEIISKQYGVSGNAVRKWCKSYNIKTKPVGYWTKQKFAIDN